MSVSTFASAGIATPIRRALRSEFVRHSALVFGASMAGNVLNYLFNFALSRRLGVEGFATLSSLVSFLMILSIPTAIVTLVVVKYAAIFHAADDRKRIRRLSQVLLKWTGLGAVAIFLVGIAARGAIAWFLHLPNDAAIPLCLGVISLGLITPSVRGILQGEQDFVRYSVSTVLEALLKVAIGVALAYAGFGVVGAMSGWIIGTACALAYTGWAVMSKHGAAAGSEVRLGLDVQRLVRTTVGVGLASGFLTCISFMDVLLVKHYFNAHEAGLYAAVSLTGKVVLFLVGFVPAVVLPKAVDRNARGENAMPLLLQAGGITLAMSGIALVAFGIFPGAVLRVLAGRDFISAAPYVLQYDAAICLLAVVTLLVNYRIGIHRFDFLYPLGAVLVGEVVAIGFFHRSLMEVIHVLLAGNALAAAAGFYRLSTYSSARANSAQGLVA